MLMKVGGRQKLLKTRNIRNFGAKIYLHTGFRYDAIFSNVAATGMRAQASTEVNLTNGQGSSYNVPYEEGDEEEDSDSNANKSDDKDFPCFGQSSLKKKRKADSNKEKKVKPKVTGASSLRESICDLVDLIKSRNASSSQPQDAPIMKEYLDTLRGLPSLAAPVRYYAQLKFVKKEIREIFMDQQNDDDRIDFVQFLYDESHK